VSSRASSFSVAGSSSAKAGLAFGAGGLLLRVGLMLVSAGTNDAVSWRIFGRFIHDRGIVPLYESYPLFNHPPLMGYWAALSVALARRLGVDTIQVFRVAPLIGDGVTAFLLYRIWQTRSGCGALAVGLYAVTLCSVLVTGHHTNTDPLCAALCLLAVDQWQRRRSFSAGLALGGAINVKLFPVLLIPVLLLSQRGARSWLRASAGLGLAALPFLPVLFLAGAAFHRNAIAYNSVPEHWGLYGMLKLAAMQEALAPVAKPILHGFRTYGRWIVVVLAMGVAVAGRRWPRRWTPYELGFMTLASFLLFAPGFGVQYTVWVLPLLFAVGLGSAVVYGTLAGVFILAAYVHYGNGAWPWFSWFGTGFPAWVAALGYLTWGLLLWLTIRVVRSGGSRADGPGSPVEEATGRTAPRSAPG
jgi:hypothetical protein